VELHDTDISQQLQDFSFFSIWCGILQQIYVISKYVLSQNFDWWNSKELTTGFHEILRKYKKVSAEKYINSYRHLVKILKQNLILKL